jgi:mevalonate kinase
MSIASAPGKVYLIGEHAVVYGTPSIISAVGLRTTVEAKKSDVVRFVDTRWHGQDFSWPLEDVIETTKKVNQLWDKCGDIKDFSKLIEFVKSDSYINYKKSIVGIALEKLSIEGGVHVTIRSNIPPGAGLGSSSSLAVALTKALSIEFEGNVGKNDINNIAYDMEKIIHGTPSGGDNSASCFGGMLWFQKNENGNVIKSLEKEIPYSMENFVLVFTKRPEKSTAELVQGVRNLDEKFRTPRINRIGKMTYEMLEALKEKEFEKMKSIINENQKILRELGVSVKDIDNVASEVRQIGGAAKLCGAGGGGIMLCYHDDRDKLIDTIKETGFTPIESELGAEGVRAEK